MGSTYHIEITNGIPLGIPNVIDKLTKDFNISYNNKDISSYGSDTTALYIKETSQFLILNGDHRNAYKELNTLEEHLTYFYNNIKLVNSMSEHGKIFKSIDEKFIYIKGGY